MHRLAPILLAPALLLTACGDGRVNAGDTSPSPTVTKGGGTRPVTNWKHERERIALRGLAYDSGRALVTAEARDVLAELDSTSADEQGRIGQEAYDKNHALDAIAAFTRAVLLEPERGERYLSLGEALMTWKLERRAMAAFRTGLDLAPRNADLVFRVGDLTWRSGQRGEAVVLFESAVDLDAGHVEAWGRLARAWFYAEDDGAAWRAVHEVEALGETVPPQMRVRLAARTAEPGR